MDTGINLHVDLLLSYFTLKNKAYHFSSQVRDYKALITKLKCNKYCSLRVAENKTLKNDINLTGKQHSLINLQCLGQWMLFQ